MNRPLVDIIRHRRDANLGQTLLRLAELAAASHQHQAATSGGINPGSNTRIGPADSQAVVHPDRCLASVVTVRFHTEVDR